MQIAADMVNYKGMKRDKLNFGLKHRRTEIESQETCGFEKKGCLSGW